MPREVVPVQPLSTYRLLLTFARGERREGDVTRLVSFRGVLVPLADESFFRQVNVNAELGTIIWPNGADLCPDVLFAKSRPVGAEHAA
jgi:hypothetical protein